MFAGFVTGDGAGIGGSVPVPCNNGQDSVLVGSGTYVINFEMPFFLLWQCYGENGRDPIVATVPGIIPNPPPNGNERSIAPIRRVRRLVWPKLRVCQLCGKRYAYQRYLLNHIKKHQTDLQKPIGSATFATTGESTQIPEKIQETASHKSDGNIRWCVTGNTSYIASSQPGGSGSPPLSPNLKGMCIICPNLVQPALQNTEVESERKKLLENVCNHFQLINIQFPKGLLGSRYPLCGRCAMLIQELGSIPHQHPLAAMLQNKVETLKKTIVELVEERHFVRTNMVDKMSTEWERVEKHYHVFTRLAEAIREVHADQLAEMEKLKNGKILRKANAVWSINSDINVEETDEQASGPQAQSNGILGVAKRKEEIGTLKYVATMGAQESDDDETECETDVITIGRSSSDDDDDSVIYLCTHKATDFE